MEKVFYILTIANAEYGDDFRVTCAGDIKVEDISNHKDVYEKVKKSARKLLKKKGYDIEPKYMTVIYYNVQAY